MALHEKSFGVFFPACGEVTERPKVHDWKSCVLKGTEGSNPSLSANSCFGESINDISTKVPGGLEAERAPISPAQPNHYRPPAADCR